MKRAPESNDFFFAKSVIKKKTDKISGYGKSEGEIIKYEPWDDTEEEWTKRHVKEQIKTTISRMQATDLKDEQRIYVVLGLSSLFTPHKRKNTPSNIRVFDNNVKKILKNLSASFLAYLNAPHNRLLISCPLSRLSKVSEIKKGCNSKYYAPLKRIGPLTIGEQVSDNLLADTEWKTKNKPVLIQLIPNLTPDLRKDYSAQVIRYLISLGREPIDTHLGMILAYLNKESTTALLETSNFVFQINEVPEGVAQLVKKRKRSSKVAIEVNSSSFENGKSKVDNLPTICLLDSGVSEIPPLAGLVQRDGYHFRDLEDGAKDDGHGTPIACLAIYGEELTQPKARIISYKIFAEDHKKLDIRAYQQAINKYSNKTRIFLSSINFKRQNAFITSELDHFIQLNNICFVVSAGNIRSNKDVLDYAMAGIPSSEYVQNYPIEDPASAVTLMAVGAISRRRNANSISQKNELAPFTTCGVTNSSLHKCAKPEVVQNGGNYCKDETCLGLESFNKFGQKMDTFVGTSFSAPILARNLAEIEAKYGQPYGGKIKNAETLKAIALASARAGNHVCMGFGETKSFVTCDEAHALVYSEGEIPLDDRVSIKSFHTESKAYIKVKVPTGVCCIEMFLVHSDNNYLTTEPCLNTYLRVYAHKEGNETAPVKLVNPSEVYKKSHMKVFKWQFRRTSMQGIWTFTIIPEPCVDMLPEHQKDTIVRYGCAIRLTSREIPRTRGFISLSERLHMNNKTYLER